MFLRKIIPKHLWELGNTGERETSLPVLLLALHCTLKYCIPYIAVHVNPRYPSYFVSFGLACKDSNPSRMYYIFNNLSSYHKLFFCLN